MIIFRKINNYELCAESEKFKLIRMFDLENFEEW